MITTDNPRITMPLVERSGPSRSQSDIALSTTTYTARATLPAITPAMSETTASTEL